MKKTKILMAIVSMVLLTSFCAGAQTASRDMNMDPLSVVSYSPSGKGYAYKQTAVNSGEFSTWANKFKPEIQKVLDTLAPGFKLQVTGHSCAIGPRAAGGGKMGNIYYSTERAKAVHKALVNAGLPADKLTYKGIADDEPLPGLDPKDQLNRRVTLKVVKTN